jgi:hypothetical protein
MTAPSTSPVLAAFGRITASMEWDAFADTSVASTSYTAVVVFPANAASMAFRMGVDGRDSARWMKSWSKANPWIPNIRRAAVLIRVM